MLELLSENEIFEGSELMAMFKQHEMLSDQFIPIQIIKEYPHYFLCEVQPHKNKYAPSCSKPYRLTINKQDIRNRNVVCRYNFI